MRFSLCSHLLMILLLPQLSAGQEAGFPPTITVSGRAELLIVPDQLTITVSIVDKATDGTTVPISRSLERVQSTLRKNGLPDSALKLAYTTTTVVQRQQKAGELRANKFGYRLKFLTMQQALTVISALEGMPNVSAELEGSERSDGPALMDGLREKALLAARAKAEKMAAVLNQSIDGVYRIEESGDNYHGGLANSVTLDDSGAIGRGQIAEMQLAANVTVVFLLRKR